VLKPNKIDKQYSLILCAFHLLKKTEVIYRQSEIAVLIRVPLTLKWSITPQIH